MLVTLRALSLVFCLTLLRVQTGGADAPNTLKLVSVLYRHGDRSPTAIYPKDINQINVWPDGLGWLTNIGKNQQFELGKYVAQRYKGFLNTSFYNHEEIVVEASMEDRCLMSAESHLAGMFPPQQRQLWNPNLEWQPIPIHTRPMEEDNKLALHANCPRYDQLRSQELNSPAIKEEERVNKDYYDMVERETGVKRESVSDIWEVADTLICEKAHNLTWNDWVNKPGVWEKTNKLRTLSFDLLFNGTEMAKLQGGVLLKEIIANMQAAATKASPLPKFYMYSAHDTTVAALLSAMRVFNTHQPMYRAMVMVELHIINSEPVVKIFYKNTTDPTPAQLNPPGCENPCKLSTFASVLKATIPVDWAEECKVVNMASSSMGGVSPASWIALCIGVGLCGIICVTLIITVMRLRRQRQKIYSRI